MFQNFPIISQSLFNLILGLLTGAVLLLPITSKIYDKRKARNNPIKGFTASGFTFILLIAIGVIVTYLKDKESEKLDFNKTLKVENEKKRSDSLADIKINKSNSEIVRAFTSSLAKYGLKYDSTQKVIKRLIQDSAKKTITNISPVNPALDLCDITLRAVTTYSTEFIVSICAYKATAYNINLHIYKAYVLDNRFFRAYGETGFLVGDVSLIVDKKFTNTITFLNLNKAVQYVYFYVKGTYTDSEGKLFKVGNIYDYNLETKKWGIDSEPYYSKVHQFFKEQGIADKP